MSEGIERRQDFCGTLVKRRKSVLEPLATYVTLENGVGARLTVKTGVTGSTAMKLGGRYTVGHMKKLLVSIHAIS